MAQFFGDREIAQHYQNGLFHAVVYTDGSREALHEKEWELVTEGVNPDLAQWEIARSVIAVKELLPVVQKLNPRLQDLGAIAGRLTASVIDYQNDALATRFGDTQHANWKMEAVKEAVGDQTYIDLEKTRMTALDQKVWDILRTESTTVGEVIQSLNHLNGVLQCFVNKAVASVVGTSFETMRINDLQQVLELAQREKKAEPLEDKPAE